MKKTISMIAALAMLLALALPVCAETVTVDEAMLGTWVMDDLGAEFTFNPDGTYTEVMGDMEGGGVYSIVNGQIAIDTFAPMDYVIDGDTMIFYDSGMEISFTRKGAAVSGTADPEALLGAWILTETNLGFTVDMKVVFNEDGTYTMSGASGEETGIYTVDADGIRFDDMDPESFTVDGDTLTLEEIGITLIFTREGAEPRLTGTADPEALIGTWALEANDEFAITFTTDGTLIISAAGEETSTTYTISVDTIITGDGEEMVFLVNEDRLTLQEAGATLSFVRK